MTDSDLRGRLADQLRLLTRSAAAFDGGDEAEALNLATRIRVLVHDTGSSTSLLAQLGVLDRIMFMDTSSLSEMELKARSTADGKGMLRVTVAGLHLIRLSTARSSAFVAPLANSDRLIPFSHWWTAAALQDLSGNQFSRRDLILAVAHKEGGAHVDLVGLDPAYEALTRANSIGFSWSTGDEQGPLGNPVPVSIRQIAYELLRSLDIADLRGLT